MAKSLYWADNYLEKRRDAHSAIRRSRRATGIYRFRLR